MKLTPSSAYRTNLQPEASWKGILDCAAHEVFQIMLGSQLGPWPDTDDSPSGDMTAMIGLAGNLCGVMNVRCSRPVATLIAGRMLGGETEPNPNMIADALGEVCNMVAGNFKAKITGLADGCMLSVPTVISGEDYEMHPVSAGETLQTAFSFNGSPVWVTLSIHS